jgi:hypothetical protein
MAKLKLAVAITRVNARYDANVTYQQGYMAGIAGTIPVERNEATGRLEVDEANLPAIAKVFGLTPVKKPQPAAKPKPTAKPTAKPKPSKPAPNRPVRSRAARSASAA